MGAHFATMKTGAGHLNDQVSSALQKSIRRGMEREALYWAAEFDLSGFGQYLWRRLAVIASEDIGLADPQAVLQVSALRFAYNEQVKARKVPPGIGPESVFLAHAVMVLCRAAKSRAVDDAAAVCWWEGHEQMTLEVPKWAIDKHTIAGRAKKRGWYDFYRDGGGAHIENAASVENPYFEQARDIRFRIENGEQLQQLDE